MTTTFYSSGGASSAPKFAKYELQKATGQYGGAATVAGWQARKMTIELANEFGAVLDLASGGVTIQAGVYKIKGVGAAYDVYGSILRLSLDAVDIASGVSQYVRNQTVLLECEYFGALAAGELLVEQYAQRSIGSTDFGVPSGVSGYPEVFAGLYIEKVG